MDASTITLVQKARDGDRAAFDGLVHLYQDRAVGYAIALLRGDRALAEDAAQEAFLLAFRELPRLRTAEAFPGWLRRIIFKCSDRLTRRKSPTLVSLDVVGEAALETHEGPHERWEAREMQAQVQAAIRMLPETERTVVTLFYLGEHTQDEIAAFLQIPAATVRKRLQRARTRLKERMLEMLETTLRDEAPSRDDRFVKRAALLRRIADASRSDERIVAVYLAGALGRGDDDAWSALKVNLVVGAEHIDDFAVDRRLWAARTAGDTPLLVVEAPQNATVGGYYLMTLHESGALGPFEVDWYWHTQGGAVLPTQTYLLFDRVGLPPSEVPLGFNASEKPEALRRAEADWTEEQRWAEEARNIVSLFWAMLLITAKYVARNPYEARMGFLEMLHGLLRDLTNHLGQSPGGRLETPEHPSPHAKLALLRGVMAEMEALMPGVIERGGTVPEGIATPAHQYLEMVETTLRREGKW